jgi:Uma2 family endonuclease
MAAQVLKHRFTADDYHQMARTGILREDDRVELVNGEIMDMTPIGSEHNASVDVLNHRLTLALGGRAIVRVQGSLRLSPDSEAQPDIAVLRFRADFYRDVVAGPADTILVIEVADTSLAYDRGLKIPLYARFGISEVWIVDLVGRQVEIFRTSTPDGYREVQRCGYGSSVWPTAFPDIRLSVDEIVG